MYIENKQIKNYISFWLISVYFLLSLMIVVGGLTRLTDSGLSITEWELLSGFIPPLNELDWQNYFSLYKEIPEFKEQNYSMSLKEFKVIFWWEWAHRLLGRLIGLFFLIPLIYFSFKVKIKKLIILYFIFFLICFQGFIGWYMVSSGLIERVDVSHYRLALHLVIAFIILSLIYWSFLKYTSVSTYNKKIKFNLPYIFLFLIFLQITIGAFVSGMDAGKIYNSWPLMGQNFFPDDNLVENIFKLSLFDEPSLVQFIHRNLAYLILLVYLYLFYYVFKNKLIFFFKIIKIIGLLLIIQIILGIFTVLSGAETILASMHQISSIFLVSSNIYLLYLNSTSNLQPSD